MIIRKLWFDKIRNDNKYILSTDINESAYLRKTIGIGLFHKTPENSRYDAITLIYICLAGGWEEDLVFDLMCFL